jgi:hypothetical protein
MDGLKDHFYLLDHPSIHHYFFERTATDFTDEESCNQHMGVQKLQY